MGLDMYLEKRHYVKNYDYMKPKDRHAITVARGDGSDAGIKAERICSVAEQVAYWRKANAVHQWFVTNVQKGKDDCGHYYVTIEQLQKLKADCDKVLANVKTKKAKVNAGWRLTAEGKEELLQDGERVIDTQIAETVMPTQGGFFFGHTDYDDWYLDSLRYTSETIAGLLEEEATAPKGCYADYYYHSSW